MRNWLRKLFGILVVLALMGLAGTLSLVYALPSPWEAECPADNVTARCLVESAPGEEIAFVSGEEMPAHLRQAFLAAEDERFYRHPGVDPLGMTRALWRNFREGRVVQGGSTITQQLAKNLYLTPERTWERKARELILALQLERDLEKDEILTAYLNLIYFGHGARGLDAAAEHYFQTEPADLNLGQSAILAGLPRGPALYSPQLNPEAARNRQAWVLEQMESAGYVSTGEAQQALQEEIISQ